MNSSLSSKISLDTVRSQQGYLLADDLLALSERYFGKGNVKHIGMARLYDNNSFSFCIGDRKLAEMQFFDFQEPIALSKLPIDKRCNQFKLMEPNNPKDIGIDNFAFFTNFHNYLQMKKSIYLAKRFANYTDMYQLSLNNVPDSFNFYLANIDKFEQFFFYLYSDGNKFINKIYQSKIQLPVVPGTIQEHNFQPLSDIHPNKFHLNVKGNSIQLSKMEYTVLKNLSLGLTSKSIASNLNISYKTVNAHLENIKSKTSLHYKDDLILCFRDNSILSKIYTPNG